MTLTWKDIDSWREQRKMTNAELSRQSCIPERTIYEGVRKNSRLQASTRQVMRQVFPEKFDERGEVRS